MDAVLYVNKNVGHIANSTTYKQLSCYPTHAIRNDVFCTIDYFYITHQIDGEMRHHLAPAKPSHTSFFYELSKVHKTNVSLWPIVSASGSPTNLLFNWYNLLRRQTLSTFGRSNASYSSLTHSLLPFVRNVILVARNVILVTPNVTSLYTKNPYKYGI